MDKNDVSCEPMEVDISANSAKKMEISYNEIVEENVDLTNDRDNVDHLLDSAPLLFLSPLLDHNINIQLQQPKVRTAVRLTKRRSLRKIGQEEGKSPAHAQIPRKKTDTFRLTGTIIFVLFLSTITYYSSKLECNEKIDTRLLKQSLEQKLFGQSDAIDAIIESLDFKFSSRVLFFYGGTGVGKTYTASILLENIHNYSNVYHYTMPSFTKTFLTEFLFGLAICKTSLIILDDLSSDDLHIMNQIESVIEKSESLKKDTTIILIFSCDKRTDSFINICDKTFETRLKDTFSDKKVLKRFINFKQLTDDHLLQCIKNELDHANIQSLDLSEIKKHFNVSIDGCKGVHKKIKMISI